MVAGDRSRTNPHRFASSGAAARAAAASVSRRISSACSRSAALWPVSRTAFSAARRARSLSTRSAIVTSLILGKGGAHLRDDDPHVDPSIQIIGCFPQCVLQPLVLGLEALDQIFLDRQLLSSLR